MSQVSTLKARLKRLRHDLTTLFSTPTSTACDSLGSLTWEHNSCYMDSVVFLLFSTPNLFLEKQTLRRRITTHNCDTTLCDTPESSLKYLLEFQKHLMIITKVLRSASSRVNICRAIRLFLSQHKNCAIVKNYPSFHQHGQEEALEFLQFILSNFGLNGQRDVGNRVTFSKRFGVFTRSRSRVQWYEWFTRVDTTASLVFSVPYHHFQKYNSLSSYISFTEESYDLHNTMYKKCLVNCSQEKTTLTSFSDVVFLHLQRENPMTGRVDHKTVQIPSVLKDSHEKGIHLDGVILHLGHSVSSGHYVCLKKCGTRWVFFDDLADRLVWYTSWRDVVRHHPHVLTHAVIFMYCAFRRAPR